MRKHYQLMTKVYGDVMDYMQDNVEHPLDDMVSDALGSRVWNRMQLSLRDKVWELSSEVMQLQLFDDIKNYWR